MPRFFRLIPFLFVPVLVESSLIWPTPNPAFQNGKPIEAYVQATVSGRVESGLFGCVRNDGKRFHEGLDLYPIKRDGRGEAVDPVYAVLPGRVAYVNRTPSYSSYGRYVVIEHDQENLAYHTLYAHLASVTETIVCGARVETGTVLGIMGRSATYTIPRSRSHVHFVIGFRLTDDFEKWYTDQKFDSKNRHGVWNGMNLVSIDPLAFYQNIRRGQVSNLREHLRRLPVATRIRVFSNQVPDFIRNYPSLLTESFEGKTVVAWDIAFTLYGVPKEWTPRFAGEKLKGQAGDVKIITYHPSLLESQSCYRVLNVSGPSPKITFLTIATIRKLFGFN